MVGKESVLRFGLVLALVWAALPVEAFAQGVGVGGQNAGLAFVADFATMMYAIALILVIVGIVLAGIFWFSGRTELVGMAVPIVAAFAFMGVISLLFGYAAQTVPQARSTINAMLGG